MAVRPLTTELQELSVNELNEIPSRVQDDLNHIQEWLSKQPHIKARTDNQWLLSFLRGCKFSLKRTKEKLDLFYTVRKLMPEFFSDRDPFQPEIQELLNQGIIIYLPKTVHPSAPRVALLRTNKMNPEKISVVSVCKLQSMMADIMLIEDDNFVVAGTCLILDLKGLAYSFATQMTPYLCKKIVMCLQDVYPIRLKEFNFDNVPSFFITIYNIIKMFFKEKIRNRVNFHADDDLNNSVSKTIPISILPKEYGGAEISCDEIAAYWKSKVESYRDWFLEDAQYCTDETKRIGKPKTAEVVFGVEGSFRKLAID